MAEAEIKRLSKVAKELNVGIANIVEFLSDKGHEIDKNPNTKITPEVYDLLAREFQGDKAAKDQSQKISVAKRPVAKETLAIDEDRSVLVNEKTQPVKETPEILIKSVQVEASEPKEENVNSEDTIKVKSEEDINVKVLGKIDLTSMNLKTKPGKKTKAEKEAEEAAEKTKKTTGIKTKNLKEEEIIPKELVEEKTELPEIAEAPKPTTPAPPQEDFLETKFEKLDGPTIIGKINLPVKEDKKKNPVASSAASELDKKKRKRIKKGAIDVNKIGSDNKPGGGNTGSSPGGGNRFGGGQQGGGKFDRGNKFGGKPDNRKKEEVKTEISDEEIQKQIKETLARLSGGGKSKSSKFRREKRDNIRAEIEEKEARAEEDKKVLKVTEFVSANELAKMMNEPVTKVISTCMSLGMFVSINQRLNAEVISIVAEEFGYQVEFVSAEDTVKSEEETDKAEDLKFRAPIVTVMGHVDHGKTSLLDYIRKANVIAGEAGGITQHIGAYSVDLSNGKRIAFLDTPGHEAFTAMRARGAQITDIVIIVIAADDSVMPQTKEAINHAQAAGVPIIFAINKVDKPDANPDKIREQLAQMNILVEEWGGKYQSQEISAKKGLNIDALLDKVLLEAELLDLKANPDKLAQGTIIESSLDKGRGYVATIMVQSGTLRVGDVVLAGSAFGRVKAMFNERGSQIKVAGPSTPVVMLGLNGAPQAGDKFKVYSDEREAKEIATKRMQLIREQGVRTHKHITLDEIGRRLAIGDFKELNIIVKGDVDGSIEALTDSLLKLSTNSIQVNVIHKSVGQVSESDVMLASASNAIIVAFNVRPSSAARKLAEQEEIDIRSYSIIYDAINQVKAAMEGMLAPEFEEKIVCNVEVREVFRISKVGSIAGCMVLDGKITRNTKVRIIRDGIVIHTGSLGSLKRFKDDVKEVVGGYECGLNIDGFNDVNVGDIIEGYEMVEIKRKL
jgi:translation initiation factor IF-2